jgi:hypothetical protein
MVEAVKNQSLEKRILELSLFHQWNLICCTMLPGSIRSKSKDQVVAFSKDGESAEMIIWNDWE